MHPLTLARAAVQEHGALQKEQELAGFLAMLTDRRPQVIVEIGSDAGGTLWAWQQLGARRVIGVDKPYGWFGTRTTLNPHGAEVVYGDSHQPETLEALKGLLGDDPVDVLFIDGDHTYDGVKADYQMYAPLVRPGGLIAFHDICLHPRMPWIAVDMLWRQIAQDWPRREEIITDPPTWGGIGILYKPLVDELAGVA